jgi:uncharacterized lipoprotein YmbA
MTIKNVLFALIAMFTLSGCITGTSHYYVLSMASQPTSLYAHKRSTIGVEKIIVPGYLYKREIAVAQNSNQITLLRGAVWAEDLDAGLTQRLIGFLQKKFSQPNVYAYPWGVKRQPEVKVNVQITRFIAQGDYVYLDANWNLAKSRSDKTKASLFSVKVPTSSDAQSIVASMDKAFSFLEEEIAKGIYRF